MIMKLCLFINLLFFSVFLHAIQVNSAPKLCLSLCEAEKIALKNNQQIKATEQLLQKAREGNLESFSKWFPELQASSDAYRTQFNQQPILNSRALFLTQLTLTQSIFSLERYYNVKISELYVQQLSLLLQAAQNDTLLQVREAYYQVILDQDNIATAKEKVELLRQLAIQMEGKYRIGEAILYNVNQSKVAVANAMTFYYQTLKQFKIDIDVLVRVLGYDPGTLCVDLEEREIPIYSIPLIACKLHSVEQVININGGQEDQFIFQPGFPEIEERRMYRLFSSEEMFSWEQIANEKRPDIRLGRNFISIAKEQIRNQQAEYYPTVDLIGNYGGFPTPYVPYPRNVFFEQSFGWGIGLELNWLLFDSFGREYRVSQAKSQERATAFNYQKTVFDAHGDVRSQIYQIEEAVASYVTARANVLLAEQLLIEAKQQMDIGYITVFDYQISVDALIQARNTRDTADFNLIVAYYSLRHASGIDVNCY
ncbi:MAG: TolC family protein [Chlamydiales bacterium]|nr:TolC family protein [Chlamydiales bacterium]